MIASFYNKKITPECQSDGKAKKITLSDELGTSLIKQYIQNVFSDSKNIKSQNCIFCSKIDFDISTCLLLWTLPPLQDARMKK